MLCALLCGNLFGRTVHIVRKHMCEAALQANTLLDIRLCSLKLKADMGCDYPAVD